MGGGEEEGAGAYPPFVNQIHPEVNFFQALPR